MKPPSPAVVLLPTVDEVSSGNLPTKDERQGLTDLSMTMDLMSSEAPLKMLSMSTGGLGKDTASLLEERTPPTAEGLWRAFLQGSHHPPHRMDTLGRQVTPDTQLFPAVSPPYTGVSHL